MSILLEILIIVTTIGSWLHMFTHSAGGVLTNQGLRSLKYYTTLSNIFAGTASALVLAYLLRFGGGPLPMWLSVVKYSSVVSVMLTFLVVMAFLGPRMGYIPLFSGSQLFLHGVGPLIAVFSFLVSRDLPELTFSCTFLAVIPTILYGAAYIANILKNGLIGPSGESNDWYGFAIGGVKSIPIAFAIILSVTWGIALLLLRLKG